MAKVWHFVSKREREWKKAHHCESLVSPHLEGFETNLFIIHAHWAVYIANVLYLAYPKGSNAILSDPVRIFLPSWRVLFNPIDKAFRKKRHCLSTCFQKRVLCRLFVVSTYFVNSVLRKRFRSIDYIVSWYFHQVVKWTNWKTLYTISCTLYKVSMEINWILQENNESEYEMRDYLASLEM